MTNIAKTEAREKFEALCIIMDKTNRKLRFKRFYPLKEISYTGKLFVFGMYDYKTKKYMICRVGQNHHITLQEIEDTLNSI